MSTNFPTSLDTFINPTPTNYLNSPSHASQHANANDSIAAIEAAIGITGSAVTSSIIYRLTGSAGIITGVDTDGTLAANSDVKIATQKAVKTYVTNNGFNGANFNAHQGFLLNGKIVPSVAGNNLTVAIKTLAGTDATAGNPIYIRIGDTVRTITAALSVTKNAATNWCNAGSAELATKEIDYFVYLGYNATDGVTIGFSRIPGASQYSDFSVTTTNEKYCAISTITTAASTDYYENVGRFAATLSAGAGYTWSVPTFTAINLIQRPIFETRLLTWKPLWDTTYIDNGTGGQQPNNVTGLYKIRNGLCYFEAGSDGTKNGTNATLATTNVPFTVNHTQYYVIGNGYNASAGIGGICFVNTSMVAILFSLNVSVADNAACVSNCKGEYPI